MQNIKICPKCNQTTTDANNAFCPFDGTALVGMQMIQNPRHTQWTSAQQQANQSPQSNSSFSENLNSSIKSTSQNKKNLWIGGGIAAFLFLFVFAYTGGFGLGRLRNNQLNGNKEITSLKTTPTITPSPTLSPTPTPEMVKEEIDQKVYQQGYNAGLVKGRNWANDMEEGEAGDKPNPFGVWSLAEMAALAAKPKDKGSWKSGWVAGFTVGFNKARPYDRIR